MAGVADPISLLVELREKVTGPAEKAGLSLDSLGEKASGMAEEFGGPVGMGLGIATAALAAVGVAVIGAGVAMASFALEVVEAKEKALATFSALAGGSEAAEALYDKLGDLRGELSMTRAQLIPITDQLLSMGVAAADIPDKLKAIATIKAVGIEGGVEAYLDVIKKVSAHTPIAKKSLDNLYKTGVNVGEVAAEMGISIKALQLGLQSGTVDAEKFQAALTKLVTDKGAPALATDSLTSEWAILKESIADLFDGVDAAPFLASFKDLLGVFGKGTGSANALKAGITAALNGIFSVAAKVLPYIKLGIEKFLIAALKVYIWLKPHFTQIGAVLKYVGMGILGIVAVAGALVAIVVGVAAVVTALTIALVGLAVALVGAVAHAIGTAIAWLAGMGQAAYNAAGDFIMGLVNGIKNGAGIVIDAVKGLGKSVLGGLKGVLGIASPSKEFAKLGQFAGAGFASGLDAFTPRVAVSAEGMGAAASGGAAAAVSAPPTGRQGKGEGKGGGKSLSVTFAPGSIVIDGAGKSAAEITETMLATVLERVALTQGLGV